MCFEGSNEQHKLATARATVKRLVQAAGDQCNTMEHVLNEVEIAALETLLEATEEK